SLHARVDSVAHAQNIAEDHLRDCSDRRVLEVELVAVAGGAHGPRLRLGPVDLRNRPAGVDDAPPPVRPIALPFLRPPTTRQQVEIADTIHDVRRARLLAEAGQIARGEQGGDDWKRNNDRCAAARSTSTRRFTNPYHVTLPMR